LAHSDETKKSPVPASPLKTNSLLRRMWEAESYSLVVALIIVSTLFEVIVPIDVVRLVSVVLLGAMLLVALRAARVRSQVLLAALLLLILALAISLVVTLTGADRLLLVPKVIAVFLLALTSLVIVSRIFRHLIVTVETIFGALSAYLLIGLFFAYTYAFVGSVAPPFFTSAGNYTIKDYLYFSFVTLTTLGFGDLVPRGDLPRMLVVVEAILGQLYLVTIVALLVSTYTRKQHPE
jgi:Ion channel